MTARILSHMRDGVITLPQAEATTTPCDAELGADGETWWCTLELGHSGLPFADSRYSRQHVAHYEDFTARLDAPSPIGVTWVDAP